MNCAQLARLLIEGPRIVEDTSGPLDPITRTAVAVNNQGGEEEDGGVEYPDQAPSDQKAAIDKKISVYMTRAALRIFSMPSLQSFWKDTVLYNDTGAEDGRCKIQFVFHRLPDEAHPMLVKLLAAPRPPKFTRFVDKGQARTGVELEVVPDDFGGEEYDYAF